jgi:ABC-2 type transport system permease protein
MTLALAFLKRDFLIAYSYKTAFVMQMMSIFFTVPMFFFIGKLFGEVGSDFLEQYEGDYFAFLLIGMALLDYLAVSLGSFGKSLRESQLMGTLELVLLSPTSLAKVLTYSSLWVYLFTTVRFTLYLTVGMALGLDLKSSNLIGAVAVLMLGVLTFAPFGILSASLIMLIKRGGGLTVVVSAASLFCGGVLYPTSVLPDWVQPISQMLPLTHTLEGMRNALLNGHSMYELLDTLLILALFAVVLLPFSLICFWAAVRRTKKTGTLAQY